MCVKCLFPETLLGCLYLICFCWYYICFFEMCLLCCHFEHFVLISFLLVFFFIVGKFLSVIVSFLSKSSAVCIILIQTSDHIYSSHNKHVTFGLLVLVRHTCLSVCHLSSLTSSFPSCSLLFAANALMSQSDSNSRVCICFNVCTRLSFPSLAGFYHSLDGKPGFQESLQM